MRNPRTKARVPEITPLARDDKEYYRENLCAKSGHSLVRILKARMSFCKWCGTVFKPEKHFTARV